MSFLSRAAPFAACLTWAALAPMAEARPVSYPGGWTVEDVQFTGLQYNRLLKRWNGPSSQANTYFKLGVGQADPFGSESPELSGFAAFAADWETRRWFTSYEAKATDYAGNKSVRHSGRVGVAPYIGDYGDLHTWLMLQVDNHPESNEPVTTTPLVRFFKGVQMVELGYTLETEELLANWIVRF